MKKNDYAKDKLFRGKKLVFEPKNRHKLNFSLLNVRSVRNKTNILRDYITDNFIDIFCLTETWLNEKETAVISEFVPETHVFHHFPREGRGGGVGVVLANFFKGIKSFAINIIFLSVFK